MTNIIRRAAITRKKTYESEEKSYHLKNVDYILDRVYSPSSPRSKTINNARILLMTDIHYLGTSETLGNMIPSVVNMYLKNKINIDCVVLNGDYWGASGVSKSKIRSSDGTTGLMPLLKKHLEILYLSIPTLVNLGNHDKNRFGTDSSIYYTNDEIYNYFTADVILKWPDIKTDVNNPHGHYWYYDIPRNKIRVICINVFETGDLELNSGVYLRDSARVSVQQLMWLANTALQFDESGWGIVVCCHYSPNEVINTKNSGAFELIKLIGEYIDGKAGTILYQNICGSGAGSISYDFSNNHSSNELICWLYGHLHGDVFATTNAGKTYTGPSSSTYTWPKKTISIGTNAASPQFPGIGEGTATVEANIADDYKGGCMESIMDFIEIDRTNKMIYCDRFGNMYSRMYSYNMNDTYFGNRAWTVSGTIVNQSGTPISGAKVYLKFNGGRRYPYKSETFSTTTDLVALSMGNDNKITRICIDGEELPNQTVNGNTYNSSLLYFNNINNAYGVYKNPEGSTDNVENYIRYKDTANDRLYTTQLRTPSNGKFSIENVAPDKCHLIVKASGYLDYDSGELDLTNATKNASSNPRNLGNITLISNE